METNSTNRIFRISDAELCMFVSNLCISLTRDLPELERYGLTEEKIAELKALGDSFEVFTTDVVFVAYIGGATEEKDILRNQILNTIREMAMRVKLRWGADSSNYKRLDLQNPSLLNADSLLVAAMSIHSKMTEFLPDLISQGLTQTMLDDFNALNSQFENSLNKLQDAIVRREAKTKERIQNANELYSLAAAYCNIGKLIFKDKNPALYRTYVINRSSPRKTKKPKDETIVAEEN